MKDENMDEIIRKIEENARRLVEVNTALEAIQKDEEFIKNKENLFEQQVEKIVEFKSKGIVIFEIIEKRMRKYEI